MITVGIDMGAKNVKVVVLGDQGVIGRAMRAAGLDAEQTARQVMAAALEEARVGRGEVARIVATGTGREDAPDRDETMTDVSCAARGAHELCPEARTVIDIGAEEARAIRCEGGRVLDFAINEKCAAGTGAFTEAMARALEVPVEELGPLSLRSTQAIPMNAQCAVFAESEVVSMIHDNVPRADMARAVHDAIASRMTAMVRRVGLEPPVVLVGGLGRNIGLVDSLKRGLALETLVVPEWPELVGAHGAALVARGGAR